MKIYRINDLDLAVAEEGAGQPVVLIHAFPLDHTVWVEQIEALKIQRRVIAPDLRGFGRSGATPGKVTLDQYADDLAAMLGTLAITEPVVLAGISMGGYIAFRFFEKYRSRVRAMILCDTRAAADTPQAAAGRLETAQRVECEGPQVLDMMLPRMMSSTTLQARPDIIENMRLAILRGSATGLAAAARGLAERSDFSTLLPRIDCPVLLVVGKHDAISTPAAMGAMVRAIPGAQLVEIDDAGHLAPLERPAEVNRAMIEFLDRL
jgi:pimeloyl-ACP methyl ester carboxylesterase